MIFALAGNQNCGKTTLFNALTGSNQHVGNFPGVTVDQKMGDIRGEKNCSVVDLPGIYSLRPYTQEEIVTRDFILKSNPDAILNIVDATNIERNLYLTLQLLTLRVPTVIALNMMDELTGNGGSIDVQKLSDALGVPVVPISAAKNEGISELVDILLNTAENRVLPKVQDFCPDGPVHRCIHAVCHIIEDHAQRARLSRRFAATKLIEGEQDFYELLQLNQNEKELIEHSIIEMESDTGLDRNAALADMRYNFIEGVCDTCVTKASESREHRRSVKIDRVLTNRYLALPLFAAIMGLVFYLTFNVIGAFLSDVMAYAVDGLTMLADRGLTSYGINPVVHSLIIDGVFAGVGSVLSFLPIIVTLFFFLSILEDSGYMARVAFVMDKLLRKIGLSGRSFVPMLIGFGCSVPAIMATRTLSSNRDRKMTILLTPFMSCSAKIPIYTLFAAAFFPGRELPVMIALYFGGMVVGILMALLLKSTLFRGNPVPFVMELPNYRFPSAKSVLLLMWEKAEDFLTRAETMDDADFVFVFGGTNDYGHGDADLGTTESRDSYTFCGAVHNLAEYLIGRYGKENLCFILPLWRYDEDNPHGEDGTQAKTRPSLKEYVRAEIAVLDALGVRYLNLRKVFPVPPTKAPSEYYVDGLHPTDKGHELLAKCIVRYLIDNGKA